tara:strand:+ start:634 stop:2373 length:1740 start_codon:yes stop_codon:yes gene_type:complete
MKKFLNKNFFEDVIKYLKIFYQNIRGNKLPDLNKIRLPKNYNKIYKKKVLIAVSTGGLSSMLVFESLIGKLLQSKNCEVDYLLCDEILPACVMATVHRIDQSNFIKKGSKKICSYCFVRSNNYLKKSGNNVVRFSELINQDELNQIKKINFEKYTFEDLKNFKFEGINIGEHANSGTIRYFSSSNLKNIKNSKETLIQYVKAALVTQKVSENLFKKKKYDEMFINHGIYVPQGVIQDCAKKFDVNTATWCFAYTRNSVNITRDDTYHRALIHEKNDKWNNFNFDKKAEQKIDEFLKVRRKGKSLSISNNWNESLEDQDLDIENYLFERKVDVNKPIIGLATNMLWDAQVYFPTNFFKDILEWLFFTIDFFVKRQDLQLVIRIHPAEVLTTTKSLERVEDIILEKYKTLPKNIFLVKPEDKISTYSIFNKCNAVLVYASKIAMETMAANIPTIVCGESFLRNKSISFDPNSKDEYFDLLSKLPFKNNPIDEKRLILAKKYAFHFFFRRTIKVNSIYDKKNKNPNIGIKENVVELLNTGEDPGIKMIIDSIIGGNDFIFKAEDYLSKDKEKNNQDELREYL